MKNEAEMTLAAALEISRILRVRSDTSDEVLNLTVPIDMTCFTLYDSTRDVGKTTVPLAVSGSVTINEN